MAIDEEEEYNFSEEIDQISDNQNMIVSQISSSGIPPALE